MIHFKQTEAFVNRTFAIGIGVIVESARAAVIQADEAELLQEQGAIKQLYEGFLSELEQNMTYLPRNQHASYLQEVAALFPFPAGQSQAANSIINRLFMQHGAVYQTAALAEAQEALQTSPSTEETASQAFLLLLTATGGLAYYQKARAEVDRQLRLVGGLAKPEGDKALLASLVDKYVPALRTPNPVEDATARLDSLEAMTLEALNHFRTTKPTPVPEVGGIELAQQITGLSKSRVYMLVSKRGIPHSKRGNKLYFNRADLLAWVEDGRRGERS